MKIAMSEVKLDNRKELSHKYLHSKQYTDRSMLQDENVLLACYRQAGDRIVHDLVGIFSFSIWDEGRKHYWCVRDQLGLAAFYYTFLEGAFISAASLTHLLELIPYKPNPNITSMQEFAWHGAAINPEHTMYEGIYRLPPGHQMTVRDGKAEVSRYWDPKSIKIDNSLTLESASERFLEIFREAVTCRLAEGETTGCELSGGLDSSSVFCIGKEQGVEIQAYSMRFGSAKRMKRCDESSYIDEILEYTGGEGVSLATDDLDYRVRYSLNFNYELAPHWPLWVTTVFEFPILEAMKKNGIRTALTGQGGDQVVAGSAMVCFDLLREMKLRAFWKEHRALGSIKWGVTNRYLKSLLRRILPSVLYERLRHLNASQHADYEMPPAKSYSNYSESYPYIYSPGQTDEIDTVTSAKHSLIMDNNIYRIAKEHYGIDFYHPFFDLRVVEFLLSVPLEFKYSDKTTKRILRSAMKDILPEGVRTRHGKAEFSAILIQQIEAVDLESFWKEAHIIQLGIVKQETLDDIHTEYISKGLSDVGSIIRYWRFINLEQWYRFNYDRERA